MVLEVRGANMNALTLCVADHPHGGGRGKSKGNNHPTSPWGIPVSRILSCLADDWQRRLDSAIYFPPVFDGVLTYHTPIYRPSPVTRQVRITHQPVIPAVASEARGFFVSSSLESGPRSRPDALPS